MVEEVNPKPKLLFERLQAEAKSHGQDIVVIAIARIRDDDQRREFFGEYLASLDRSNSSGVSDDLRKHVVAKILQAIPGDHYLDYEAWSRTMNPKPLPPPAQVPSVLPQARRSR